jgi:hypothetical protein
MVIFVWGLQSSGAPRHWTPGHPPVTPLFVDILLQLLQVCWAQQTCYKLFQQLVIVLQFNSLSTSCERDNLVATC